MAAAAAALSCALGWAGPADTRVTGTLGEVKPGGGSTVASFTCFGMPTCTGTTAVNVRSGQCSNTFSFTTNAVLTGLDLSHAGPLSGSTTIDARQTNTIHNMDGSCVYQMGPGTTWTMTGSWDGTVGNLTLNGFDSNGAPQTITGSFSANVAAASPVFPMVVTGSVTPTSANVSATIQPRPQDVGSSESIFVFAHAPSNLVQGAVPAKRATSPPVDATPEDDAVVCILAQVDANGHLVAVSASTMQAFLTGVLSSQGQAVNVLNNVATSNVAGASLFVGYGASAASMLANGVFQNAVNVPGAVQCTASLASAPAAATPAALSGLWYSAAESGWGIQFTQRGTIIFAAWYTYDAAGNPKWYVAPNCPMASSNAVTGSCTGSLFEVNGPTFFGVDFKPISQSQVTTAGSLTINFQNANNASMSYTVGSQSRTVAIVRQIFDVPATNPPAVNYTDLWWNPTESGWGMAITQQFGNIFLAWYVYDASGKPFWYVAPSCTVSGSSCSGALYRTTAPAFGPPLDPTKVQAFSVGSAIVSFVDANHGVLSYVVDGVSATKVITRQLF